MNRVIGRLRRFRDQLIVLWHAFLDPKTPLYLKIIMIAVLAYVVSPVDFLPDIFAVFGWVDDALLIAFAVDWIISRLPRVEDQSPSATPKNDDHINNESGPVIEGNSRRQ